MNKQQLETAYDIEIESFELIRESSDNRVYELITNDSKYFARESKRVVLNYDFELLLISYLAKTNVPVPKIIPTRDCALYIGSEGEMDKNIIVIFEYIEGVTVQEVVTNNPSALKKSVIKGARALAQLHNKTKSFNSTVKPARTIIAEVQRGLVHENMILEYTQNGGELMKNIKTIISFAKKYDINSNIIHNDYRMGNVMMYKGEITAIIDFDWACYGPNIKDLAHAAMEWSFPDGGVLNENLFELFVTSYNENADNPQNDIEEIRAWVRFAALSDAVTYIGDRFEKGDRDFDVKGSYMYQKFEKFASI